MNEPIAPQRYELTPLDHLTPHPDNPRRGDVPAIAESITSHGFYGAVIAQTGTGHVLAGNHRLAAAHDKGLTELPVIWVDVDDDDARQPQVQERLTEAIADDLDTHLTPAGCGVRLTATHHCMSVRGVHKPGAAMTTTALRGAFHTPETRAEFLNTTPNA